MYLTFASERLYEGRAIVSKIMPSVIHTSIIRRVVGENIVIANNASAGTPVKQIVSGHMQVLHELLRSLHKC